MRNLMLACAAIAAIGVIVSGTLWRELRAERAQSAELRSRLLEAALVQERPAQALPTQRADAPVAVTPTSPAGGGPAVPASGQENASRRDPAMIPRNVVLNQAELMKDPEYRSAMLAQQRMTLPRMYPGLAEELGLSPQESDALFDLLAEFQMQQNEHMMPLNIGQQPDAGAIQEMARQRQDVQRRQDEALTALLGAGRAQQFRDFRETQGARMQASEIARSLEGVGHALTRAQARELTSAFVAEDRRNRSEAMQMINSINPADQSRLVEEAFRRQEERNARIVDAARAHLDAAQLQTLQGTLDQQLAMNRASTRMFQRQMEQRGESVQAPVVPATTVLMMAP